ncbi:hypothetical protein EVAR_97419_1 [Eumeta japonica]|uniref:Uncharacterized protein n=1 Tax=Eumeta variegata TaxID=151549 RepID=A0A4C1WX18_EUMVA|nr:hypothetical protein EVAR_97419_1 [Eumeta japonica]
MAGTFVHDLPIKKRSYLLHVSSSAAKMNAASAWCPDEKRRSHSNVTREVTTTKQKSVTSTRGRRRSRRRQKKNESILLGAAGAGRGARRAGPPLCARQSDF